MANQFIHTEKSVAKTWLPDKVYQFIHTEKLLLKHGALTKFTSSSTLRSLLLKRGALTKFTSSSTLRSLLLKRGALTKFTSSFHRSPVKLAHLTKFTSSSALRSLLSAEIWRTDKVYQVKPQPQEPSVETWGLDKFLCVCCCCCCFVGVLLLSVHSTLSLIQRCRTDTEKCTHQFVQYLITRAAYAFNND